MRKGFFRQFILGFLLLFVTLSAFAQTQSTIYWYFGNSGNGFRFIRPGYAAEAVTIPRNLGTGMSAVATDPVSGVILFYTDGINVYDRDNNIMPNGTGLSGSGGVNQGVAICANPNNPDQYFIFTNNGSIRVTTVDMNLNAANANAIPRGDVTTKNQPVNGLAGTYDPGMIILPKDDRSGFWLIAHQTASTSYNAINIDATGTVGLPPTFIVNAPTVVDNFSYNAETGQLAIAPRTAAENASLVTFNTATGAFGAAATAIPGTSGSTQVYNIYDTEWSNNGRYLFLSGNFSSPSDALMQVDLTETPLTLRPVPTQNMLRSYGLQMAPDSSIYHLYQHTNGSLRVGRINDPDTIAAQVRYTANAFGGNINYQGRQFPAFLPPFDPMIMATIEIAGTCASVPTLFFPTIEPGADSVRWDFGDGAGSTDLAPFHTYEQGGNYNVALRVYLNGDSATFTQAANITQFDLQISGFPQSDTVCAEDFAVEYTAEAQSSGGGQGPQPTFRWSNQLIDDATTTIDSAGNYYVTATDPTTGCVAYQSLRVVEYRAIQQRAFIWYFGEHAGIDFNPIVDVNNPGPARPIPFGDPDDLFGGNQLIAPEGCAIFCDDNGQPLFYSDGVDLYDRLGQLVATDIGGSKNATQSVFIMDFPNDATLFYIFLARQVYDPSGNSSYELNYVVFDLKQRDGLGDLIRDTNDDIIITKLYSPNTERITGNQNWVVVHEWGNSNFRAYPVNAQGIGAAIVSNVGSVHNSATSSTAQGYMKLAPTGKLAVGVSQSNTENYVELFDFDNTSGEISNPLRLDFGNETGQVYGIEFSSDYRKVFATIRTPGGPSKVYRWQIDSTTVAGNETDPSFIRNSRNLVASEASADLGAMQLGPDGQIYIARDGSANLATITNPNADMTTVPIQDAGYLLDGFGLGENLVDGGFTRSLLGLPNFASQYVTSPQEIGAEVMSGCIGETLEFNVINTQSLETYRWNIYDSDSVLVSSGTGETYEFSTMNPGIYTVRVDVIPDCQIVESMPLPAFATFEIFGEPVVNINNIINPSSCGNSNGQFTVSIPELTGSYAFELSGPIAFVSDTIPGPVNQVVDNLPAGTYNIYVINTITGCQSAASAVLTDMGVRFTLNATPTDATCAADDGEVSVSIIPDAGYTVGYPVDYILRLEGSDNGIVTGTYDNADGLQTINATGLFAGVYNMEVTELGGDGCTNTIENIVIGTPPLATLDVPEEVIACDVNEAQIPITTNAPGIRVLDPAPGNYEIINGELRVFAQGDWIIETVDQSGGLCPTTATVPVTFANSDPLPPTIERSYSICPDDPVEENRSATIDPGNATYFSLEYFDEQGNPIVGMGPDYSLNGDVLTVYKEGPIQIEITNAFGCVTRATINVLIDCQARINAPDAFKPGSSIQENQVWKVYPFLVSENDFQVFIFNRWGEMIAQSSDLNFEWNGGYDNNPGKPVPGGTYAYRVIYKSIYEDGRGLQEERGAILLIR